MHEFYDALHKFRRERHYTQGQTAELLGLHPLSPLTFRESTHKPRPVLFDPFLL
ncbi:MAG: hypothetical protein IJ357_00100 [Oscillospiraceae bacterium]|nr:hypothetical protein [Oscillospiraceae bacterium]